MICHSEKKSLAIRVGHHTYSLDHPELEVTEGTLNRESCREIHFEPGEEIFTISLRWKIQNRIFLGSGTVKGLGSGFCWQLRVWPEDGRCWKLLHTSEGSGELLGWVDSSEVKLFHGDNIRGVTQKVFLMEGTYFVPIQQWTCPVNAGRWQSFPGLWLRESERAAGFVCGVLSQNIWKHTLIGEITSASALRLRGKMSPPGIDGRPFLDGKAYDSEPLYFEWVKASTPAEAFAGYLEALNERLTPCKSRSALRHAVSWDSWNDRQPHFWDVSEALLLRTAEVLKQRFPTVGALQIDDGYADGGFCEVAADRWTKLEHGMDPNGEEEHLQRARRLGVAFLHEPGHAIASDRFPHGMRETRNQILRAGLIPGIWLGLNIIFDATLAKDHPEWIIHPRPAPDADPELQTVFGADASQGFRILDPSLPEVRNYLEEAAKLLLQEWGFEALKLDFWSYAFENDCCRLQRGEKSAYEWRTWIFDHFRSCLAERSFFTIGCDISTGNPFLCPWVDNVRYGIDIGDGRWENIKYTALTGTFLLHVEAYRFYLLNSDSVGLLENLPTHEKLVFWAWAAVTRSLCEVAGDLARQPREELRALQKLLLAPKNGDPSFPGGTQHLQEDQPAALVWTPGDLFSTGEKNDHLPDAVLAVFNWTDQEIAVRTNTTEFGWPSGTVADVNFFNENCVIRTKPEWEVRLAPHSVRLSHISLLKTSCPRILESSWQVQSVASIGESLEITLHGDSPEGFLIYWPANETPQVDSSLPAKLQAQSPNIFRILPNLVADRLGEWKVRIVSHPNSLESQGG